MPVRIPQIIITLSPQGDLQAELPWAGGRRIIRLGNTHGSKRDEAIELTLRRMLEAQRDQRVIVGEDGAPVQQQVEHWEKHSEWPNEQCPFCRSEGRLLRGHKRTSKPIEFRAGDGSVKVRKISPQGKLRQMGRSATATASSDLF